MKRLAALLPLLLSACATAQAVTPGYSLDPNTRPSCETTCKTMGLELTAVVLVRNSAGCVCTVPGTKPSAGLGGQGSGGAVAVAGGVIVTDEENEQGQALVLQNQQAPVNVGTVR